MKNLILLLTLLLFGCTNRDTPVDKSTLLGYDFRLFQNTPAWDLAKAVEDGDTDQIKEEIKQQPKILEYAEPTFGHTLLQMAVMNRNYPSVEALLELGADPNKQDTYFGSSALMESLSIGGSGGGPHPDADSRYLKILLRYGGNPNAIQNGDSSKVGQNHFTVLDIACSSGDLEYVKILVNAGANITLANGYGHSCLSFAVDSQNPDIVLYLLKKGADYTKPIDTNLVSGKKIYLLEAMDISWQVFKSPEFLKKRQLINDFINSHNQKVNK